METVTAITIEQSDGLNHGFFIAALKEAIQKLGSDELKKRFIARSISMDTDKCHYTVRNDATTFVFTAHLGNLIDEVTWLVKIAASPYGIKTFEGAYNDDERDYFDFITLVEKAFKETGMKIHSSNIEFCSAVTSLCDDDDFGEIR